MNQWTQLTLTRRGQSLTPELKLRHASLDCWPLAPRPPMAAAVTRG